MEMTLEAVRKNLEYLEHYGVKGQRWGVRRTPEQLGHILKKKNARHYGRYNAAVKRISEIQGDKSISQLSSKDKKKIAKAIEKAQTAVGKIQSTEKKFAPKIEKAEERQAKQEQKTAEKEAKATAKKEAAQAKADEKAQKEQAKNEKLKAKIMKDPNWDEVYANRNLFSNQELNDITNRIATESRMRKALDEDSTFNRMADKMKTASNVAGAGLDLYNKAKDIKGIFDAGKKDKAYAEIRQLMADGNYAEVVKKSTVLGDKDIENFSKRKTLLDNLRKDSGYTITKSAATETKDKSDEKDTKTSFKEGAQTKFQNTKKMPLTKEEKKEYKEAFKNIDLSANIKNALDSYAADNRASSKALLDAKKDEIDRTLQKSLTQLASEKRTEASKVISDRMDEIRKKKDTYVPPILAEFGKFKINDFIVDYSTPRGTGVHA